MMVSTPSFCSSGDEDCLLLSILAIYRMNYPFKNEQDIDQERLFVSVYEVVMDYDE